MPSFCRHNRFIERCPICSATLPDHLAPARPTSRPHAAAPPSSRAGARVSARTHNRRNGEQLRVRHEQRAVEDGYENQLLPGLRASADARRLAGELAFAAARLTALETSPPGLYGEIRELARAGQLEQASWVCFLTVYLSPLQEGDGDGEGEGDPFAGIRMALAAEATSSLAGHTSSLADIPLGPRTSHAPARGAHTLLAYRQWVARAGSTPEGVPGAFLGEPSWTPERRFERVFERLALPGFARMGRYELLVTLGRLAVYPLRPATLALVAARASGGEDPTLLAAKRVFGIGDSQLMERRALALAQALEIPLDALELALANWEASQRATLGFPAHIEDLAVRARAQAALGL